MPRILHLTLTKEWFSKIASGEKTEEYRAITEYWEKRLFVNTDKGQPKQYDIIQFRNGYQKNPPTMEIEWRACWIGEGKEEWGAKPGTNYYVIELGKILSIKNYTVNEHNGVQ